MASLQDPRKGSARATNNNGYPQYFVLRDPEDRIITASSGFFPIAGVSDSDKMYHLNEDAQPWHRKIDRQHKMRLAQRTQGVTIKRYNVWFPTFLGWRYSISTSRVLANGHFTVDILDATDHPMYQRWLKSINYQDRTLDLGPEYNNRRLSHIQLQVIRARLLGYGWAEIAAEQKVNKRTAREWFNQFRLTIEQHADAYYGEIEPAIPGCDPKLAELLLRNGLGWFLVNNEDWFAHPLLCPEHYR